MRVFIIILAVLVVIFAVILSLSAEFTIIYENGWQTKIRVLFIERDIVLSKLLSFILFPEKAAKDVAEKKTKKEDSKAKAKGDEKKEAPTQKAQEPEKEQESAENKEQEIQKQEANPNFIKKLLDKDGVLGILLLVSNLLQSANSAVTTLIKGLHIYSLYVKMIIGGYDSADIGLKYGKICSYYYPVKGVILNGMRVDNYDDYITADFIAPYSEYEFQIIASINIALLLKVVLNAGKVFLVNLIKNK